ncbi:MAG TPA: hypothetical protein GX717_04195, partial [Clostridiaceae bacterium]|nr:hypothetical protein [Clostridiaceae bacterium]
MVRKEKEATEDKIARRRKERDRRLESQKAADGTKKPIKTGSRLGRILFPIIVVLLVVVVAIWIIFATGVVERKANPISVGSDKVSVVEYNYYFSNQMNQFAQAGLLTADAQGKPDLSAPSALDEEKTWLEYFQDMTDKAIQDTYIKVNEAKKSGIELSSENQEKIDSFFEEMEKQVGGEVELRNRFIDDFGKGASKETIEPIFQRLFLAQQYETEHKKSYDFSEEEIKSYYNQHRDDMDLVTYRSFMISPDKPAPDAEGNVPELSEEEKIQAKEEAKAQADAMLAEITDEESFREAAIEFAPPEKKADYEGDSDPTLQTLMKSSIVNAEVADWVFDAERENGDTTVVESNEYYFVLYFISRNRDEMKLPTVRHILISANRDTATDEEKSDALKIAEETMERIDGEADMETIGDELVVDGIATESNIYENVSYGQMVEEFNDWIF